ncbi:MAG: two-component sensor histidine kinase, partial [Candidatus Eisenbacteria bacterium]
MASPSAPANGHTNATQLSARAAELYADSLRVVHVRTDRMFVTLALVQWLAALVAALVVSPRAWAGH